MNDFSHAEFKLWAVLVLDVDEFDVHYATSWNDDSSVRPELRRALNTVLGEMSPVFAAQALEDVGAEEFRAYLFDRARRLCRFRQGELETMPYYAYLRTPEWGARAEETYRRFGYRCAMCNAEGDLNAHHRTYERRGREDPDDLTAVCPTCHSIFHEWGTLTLT